MIAVLALFLILLCPISTQADPIAPSQLEAFVTGPDGEADLIFSTVKLRKEGDKLFRWDSEHQDWLPTTLADLRRGLMIPPALASGQALDILEMSRWLRNSKSGDTVVGYLSADGDLRAVEKAGRTYLLTWDTFYTDEREAAELEPVVHQRAQMEMLRGCKSNLKNIGTALEMYGTDHEAYPRTLAELTPDYLRFIPVCPAAGSDTYSADYAAGNNSYRFHCKGTNHSETGTPADFPAYNSEEGLLSGE
ncbi:MAG: hypothetical protein HY319_06885 [Armatimonadetes bacterium]|nr:hypothetical protein [Armatimonadota bacterium]